jgi:RNA polymerase sigma-70 factor, ECF subfamily
MGTKETAWAAAMRAERQGDSAAYERLLADVSRALRVAVGSRAARLGLPAGETEDIVQEVLIGLHTMRRHWQQDRPFLPWLHAIVRYKMTDAMRRRSRERRNRVELSLEEWNMIAAGDDHAEAFHTAHDMEHGLAALPAGQRGVVEAMAVEGASVREAANRFGTSEGAVRMTMHRALKKLSAWAEGGGDKTP